MPYQIVSLVAKYEHNVTRLNFLKKNSYRYLKLFLCKIYNIIKYNTAK